MFFNFECENFKSLREETFFSALASVDDTHEELVGKFDELRYLKTLLVLVQMALVRLIQLMLWST